jgi:hypothetical protein
MHNPLLRLLAWAAICAACLWIGAAFVQAMEREAELQSAMVRVGV